MSTQTCNFVPFPGNGAYGHWSCQLSKHHRGRHRFNNATIARIPRVWHLRTLWRLFKGNRRLARLNRLSSETKVVTHSYRRALYPTTFDPIDTRTLEAS